MANPFCSLIQRPGAALYVPPPGESFVSYLIGRVRPPGVAQNESRATARLQCVPGIDAGRAQSRGDPRTQSRNGQARVAQARWGSSRRGMERNDGRMGGQAWELCSLCSAVALSGEEPPFSYTSPPQAELSASGLGHRRPEVLALAEQKLGNTKIPQESLVTLVPTMLLSC